MGRRRHLKEAAKLNCRASSTMNDHAKGFASDGRNEDKHSLSSLQMPMIPTFVADQTPTPTRFLRSLEDAGLFNEICRSPYADDFKRHNSSEDPHGHTQTENSTALASKQHAPIPSVILESVADEADEDASTNNLLHDDSGGNFVVSTVDDGGSNLVYSIEQEGHLPAEVSVSEQSMERRVIQVLIQIPNVGLMPINIPVDALAMATFPVTTSPAISISSSLPQNLVTPSPTQSGITSTVKQKLKATLQQNLQHQQIHSVTQKSQWHQPVPAPPPPPPLKEMQPARNLVPVAVNKLFKQTISPASSTGPSLAKTPKLSTSAETSCSSQDPSDVMNVSNTRSSRSSDDEDGEEKRKVFLESNRAAANRCRQKKKQWINSLEEKTKHLLEINKSLTSETAHLRKEITSLKQALHAHKDCSPITIITSNF